MIIIGYQGIGKSSTANPGTSCIDLESNNFFVDGERPANWYKYYCNIAEHLSNQGFIIFTSSHKVVREEFAARKTKDVAVCYPVVSIRRQWIKRLEERYERTKSEKDFKALANAEDCYSSNIEEIYNDAVDNKWTLMPISTTNYNLYYDIILAKLLMRSKSTSFAEDEEE